VPEQREALVLDSGVRSELGSQPLHEWTHQHTHLGLAHVVFRLRLLYCIPVQMIQGHCSDLLTQLIKQSIGDVLHHHRLQRKTGLLSPLDQGPS
jgi:hypothetical protein